MASLSTDTASLSSYSSTGINTSSTKTNTTNNNNNTEEPTLLTTTTNNNNTSSNSNSNSNSLSSSLLAKRTVVTSKRKEELLLRARTERKRWIRTVILPYDIKKLGSAGTYSTNTSDSSADTKSSPSTTRQNDCDGDGDGDNGSLDKLQNSLICSNRYLSNATSVLSELYGITINDNDDDDDNDDDGHNVNAIVDNGDGLDVGVGVKKYPLSIDEVSDRVERLLSTNNSNVDKDTVLAGQGPDDQKSSLVGKKNSNDDDGNGSITNKYDDLLKSYKEFTESMLLPESAVTVQGMKNFIRQFGIAAEKKNNDNDINDNDDKDALLRNMATSLNNHVRSSYESLAGTRNNSGGVSDSIINNNTQGGGQPDYDRRSLESFIYGQVKDVVLDPTLDRIIGCSKSSTFPMTQKQFDVRLQELQFLQPSHLDIACLNDDDGDNDDDDDDDSNDNDIDSSKSNNMKLEILLKEPIKALQSIEAFYSPYEKLQRVLDVFRGVNAALTKTSKTVPSADDVLPTVILVIVKAAAAAAANTAGNNKTNKKTKTSSSSSSSYLKNLLRDLYFVECFALEEYLRGEAGYAFTNLYSAAQFLQELDLNISEDKNNGNNNNSLSISSDELKRGLEKSRAVNNAKRNSITGGGTNGDFESQRQQKKGLISRGVDELLGGGNNSNNTDAAFAAIPVPPTLTVREVRAARLRGETLDLDWALRLQEKQPTTEHEQSVSPSKLKSHSHSHSQSKLSSSIPQRYTFLGVRPENVKLSDLPKLLDEYRRLVLTTEELLGEQQKQNNRIQSERKRIRDEKHRRGLGERALLL